MTADSLTVQNSLTELLQRWETRAEVRSSNESDFYNQIGQRAIELGHASLAFDVLKEGSNRFPNQPELVYLFALACARGGSIQSASELVKRLINRLTETSPIYPKALELAGRLSKDQRAKFSDPKKRLTAAVQSADHYKRAFAITGDYYPGINAATMSTLAGREDEGREIAQNVHSICLDLLHGPDGDEFWIYATLGEACLLLNLRDEAEDWYNRGVQFAKSNFGDIASMRRQLRTLVNHLRIESSILDVVKLPNVVVFAGHMIDEPGRRPIRFPAAVSPIVSTYLDTRLDQLNANFGYCSAACGGDLLFIETMLARGGEVHIVLPFSKDDFIASSVAYAGNDWVKRFDTALLSATSIAYATEEPYLGDDILFRYTADLINGMAHLHAEQLETESILLALLDTDVDSKMGGTMDTVERWQTMGNSSSIVDLREIRTIGGEKSTYQSGPVSTEDSRSPAISIATVESGIKRQIQTMLFADVVGFSKLGEESAVSFFVGFLGHVADIIKASSPKPSFCNTWGDGLFVVFDDVTAAAVFSLTLRDMVIETDWKKLGLPTDISIRIGMHTGPVFRANDPILHRDNFFGSQVNRAARVEPIAMPSSVLVTEQCACILLTQDNGDFECEYLGIQELAKKYGSGKLYRLRRSHELE